MLAGMVVYLNRQWTLPTWMREGSIESYRIFTKYWNTLFPYHTCPKIFDCQLIHLGNAGRVANSAETNQMPHSAASDLGLHCLLRPLCSSVVPIFSMNMITFPSCIENDCT